MCPIYSRLFFLPNWYKIKEMFLYSIKPLGIFHFILFYLILFYVLLICVCFFIQLYVLMCAQGKLFRIRYRRK